MILKTNAQKRFEKAVEKIDSIDMLSKRGWKELHKRIIELKVNRFSNPETLSDGFVEFIEVWNDDHKTAINIFEPEIEGKLFIYFDEFSGRELVSDVNLEKVLIDRFSEYLLGD